MSKYQVVMVSCECIVRMANGQLGFVGPDPVMAKVIERINAGTASETDLIAASAYPVFDESVADEPVSLIVKEVRR